MSVLICAHPRPRWSRSACAHQRPTAAAPDPPAPCPGPPWPGRSRPPSSIRPPWRPERAGCCSGPRQLGLRHADVRRTATLSVAAASRSAASAPPGPPSRSMYRTAAAPGPPRPCRRGRTHLRHHAHDLVRQRDRLLRDHRPHQTRGGCHGIVSAVSDSTNSGGSNPPARVRLDLRVLPRPQRHRHRQSRRSAPGRQPRASSSPTSPSTPGPRIPQAVPTIFALCPRTANPTGRQR